jgi:hypothetical protein
MSRDNAPRRWWSGQWLMVLLGLIAASILFRFGSDRGWWFGNNWASGLGFLNQTAQPYETVNTGASVQLAATNTPSVAQQNLNQPRPTPVTPMPPTDSYTPPSNGRKAMW